MKFRHIRLLALLAALPLAACGDDDPVEPVQAARVRLLNAVTDAGSLNLRLDAGNITTGLAYNNAPAYARVRSGSRTLSVRTATGTADLISTNVNLATDQDYTYIYAGRTGGTGNLAPRFIQLQDNGTTPTGTNGALRVVHASAGAAATAVDVYLLTGTTETVDNSTPEFSNIAFGAASGYVTAPAGTYSVVITPTGTKTASATVTGVTLAAGQKRTAVVIGDPTTTPAAALGLRVMTDN